MKMCVPAECQSIHEQYRIGPAQFHLTASNPLLYEHCPDLSGYLEATNDERPFTYKPVRSFDEVSKSFVGELVERVFQGSRERLLVQLLGKRKKLTAVERDFLQQVLKEQD